MNNRGGTILRIRRNLKANCSKEVKLSLRAYYSTIDQALNKETSFMSNS